MRPKRSITNRRALDDLWEQLDRWGIFILANLLWVALAIPLITLPAATAGLFATMSRWTRGKPPELFQEFFGGMRRYWLTSTLLVLLDVAIGGLLVFNLSVFPMMDLANPVTFLSRTVTLFAALILVLVNLYAWPLLVVLEMPIRPLLAASLKLAMMHPLASIGIVAATCVPAVISLLLPQALLLFVTFSCSVFIWTWGTWRIIRRHISDDDRMKLESSV